ncbi:MAG: hypothetical protein WBP11_13990 [Dokdonella sp.]
MTSIHSATADAGGRAEFQRCVDIGIDDVLEDVLPFSTGLLLEQIVQGCAEQIGVGSVIDPGLAGFAGARIRLATEGELVRIVDRVEAEQQNSKGSEQQPARGQV